jgi:hypothetical protein
VLGWCRSQMWPNDYLLPAKLVRLGGTLGATVLSTATACGAALDKEMTICKIVVSEFVSLDGVMQAPGGADEDREGGFVHGGWTHPYWQTTLARSSLRP